MNDLPGETQGAASLYTAGVHARCASPPMYLVRCRWWTPQPFMSGPYACRAPEGPVCREARAWCDVAARLSGLGSQDKDTIEKNSESAR